jgi:hypothetical protein
MRQATLLFCGYCFATDRIRTDNKKDSIVVERKITPSLYHIMQSVKDEINKPTAISWQENKVC